MDNILEWEYKTSPLCHPSERDYYYPRDKMNEMGAEGWEAICIYEGYIYFKRPKKKNDRQ